MMLRTPTYHPLVPIDRHTGMAHHHGEPDELYTLRQEFYVGNYQVRFMGRSRAIDP